MRSLFRLIQFWKWTQWRSEKDGWDRLEVLGKVLLPVVVAATAAFLNGQISQRESSARMVEIAVGIVTQDPGYEEGDIDVDPLREWAISVLQDPENPPRLSSSAASILRRRGLPEPRSNTQGLGSIGLENDLWYGLPAMSFENCMQVLEMSSDIMTPEEIENHRVAICEDASSLSYRARFYWFHLQALMRPAIPPYD